MGNWPCFFPSAEFVVVIGCAVVGCGRCGRDGRVLEARAATAQPNACRTNSQLESYGDDIVDGTDSCDDGANNSDSEPGLCRAHGVLAFCGDGVVDLNLNEDCDNGAGHSDTTPNDCRTTCQLAGCGDGVLDDFTEVCDDGAASSPSLRPAAFSQEYALQEDV
jgi:hypothetical protein